MKKKIVIGFLGLVVACAAVFGYLSYSKSKNQHTDIAVTKLSRGDIENTVTATGMVSPKSSVDVGAQVSGQVMQLGVEVGDYVKKGDLLAEIDTTVLEAKVESSKAELLSQQAQVKDREAKLTLAKLAYERQKELLENDATSKEAYENAEASLRSAEASIDMIKAQIVQTESSLKENQANLKYAKIYAPMSGTVSSVSVKKGQTLNANLNTPPILQIADLSTVTIAADVSEADVTKLKRGLKVYFKTLGSSNIWYAQLSKVEPTPNVTNNVVLYKAIFDVNNTSGELMNSMTTQVFFVLSSSANTTILPITAISRKEANSSVALVMVQKADGSFTPQEVKLGVVNRVQAEILSGLSDNDVAASSFASAKQTSTKDDKVDGKQRFPMGRMR